MNNSELDKAKTFLDHGDFNAALKLCEKIIDTEPQIALAYQFACVALANLRRYPDALQMSLRALELDPNLLIPHTTMAIVYDELGEKEKSRKEVKIALDKDSGSSDALCCAGILSLVDNRLDDAAFYLEKAVKIDPSLYLAHYNLAAVYQSKKDSRKLLRQTFILFKLKPSTKSLFRLMFILSRQYKFLHFPILLLVSLLALIVGEGTEIIIFVAFVLAFVWFAGGIYIGFMTERRQSSQLIVNLVVGSSVASLGILIYLWIREFFRV